MARQNDPGFGAGLLRRSIPARFIRAGLILLLGWLALEAALLHLVAERIGWGSTIAALTVKGGLGLLILGWLTMRGLGRLRGRLDPADMLQKGISAGFGISSAILIALPGLVPTTLGIALFSPSLRSWILRRFSAKQPSNPREIALDEGEWRELRRRKARKSKPGASSLEAKPPSV